MRNISALLGRAENERQMISRYVCLSAVAFICLLIWAILGFPLIGEVLLTAISSVVIYAVGRNGRSASGP